MYDLLVDLTSHPRGEKQEADTERAEGAARTPRKKNTKKMGVCTWGCMGEVQVKSSAPHKIRAMLGMRPRVTVPKGDDVHPKSLER